MEDWGESALDDARESGATFDPLRGADGMTQVDLNEPENLADLEDPGLSSHMSAARTALEASQSRQAALRRHLSSITSPDVRKPAAATNTPAGTPAGAGSRSPAAKCTAALSVHMTPAQIAAEDAGARRALSAVTVTAREHNMQLHTICESVMLQATNVDRLAAGDRPHGYPAAAAAAPGSPAGANLAHLSKQLRQIGQDITDALAKVSAMERDLTTARRQHEKAIDGLRDRHDAIAHCDAHGGCETHAE